MGEEEGGIVYKLETPEGELTSSRKPPYTGHGKATYPNEWRDTYEGEFVEGYRCGWGTYVFKQNGDTYTGQYENNSKHGLGKIIYSSTFGNDEGEGGEGDEGKPTGRGGFYHGYFTSGLRGSPETKTPVAGETMKSEGTFTYCNGDVYVGQWQKGKKHGIGTYQCAADRTKLKGEWIEGKMSSGQWIFPNGAFFSGKFRYNKPFGKGVWVFPNGNQLTGEYTQKEIAGEEGEAPAEEEGEGATKKDPQVECTFKYGNCVLVKGDAPPRQVKYTQMRT
jgi:hypothetical protein